MKKITVKPAFRDSRGTITDMVENEKINAVTLVQFKKNSLRGNHFHKKTWQWNYILSGKILVCTQNPGKKPSSVIFKKGDFFLVGPKERHAFKALENSDLMVFTKGPRGGKEYESDTFRMEKPLIQSSSR